MAQEALVESQLADSQELLRRLDAGGNSPAVAVWYYYADIEKWRLLLAGPTFDSLLPKRESFAYRGLAEEIIDAGLKSLSLADVKLVRLDYPLVVALRRFIRTPADAIQRNHFVNNTFNGIFIEAMIVLRSA